MKNKIIPLCLIRYDEANLKLSIEVFGGVRNAHQSTIVDREMTAGDLEHVKEAVEEYWRFVDEKIKEGIVDNGEERKRKRFYDDLKAKSSAITLRLLGEGPLDDLWSIASQSDIFLLSTNLQWVPWETLYNPGYGNGEFLSDNCVISRIASRAKIDNFGNVKENSGRIVCIDPILDEDYEKCENVRVSHIFEGKGEEVYLTDLVGDLADKVKTKSVISWICEHETEKGLRLCSDVHFNNEHVHIHKFPQRSLVFIVSCAGARSKFNDVGMSEAIVSASDCTVVAPSSMISAKAGVDFVGRLLEIIKKEDCKYLYEVWAKLKRPFGGEMEKQDEVTAERFYSLWFSIFGDCEAEIKEIK